MIQPCGTGVASVCQPHDHVTDLRGGYRGGAHNGHLLWSFTDRRFRAIQTTSLLARLPACSGLMSVLYVVSILAFDAQTDGKAADAPTLQL